MGDQEYGGPYLQAALFCDKVLQEKDGVISAIRIIDRITVTVSGNAPPEKMPLSRINVTALLSFKSGFYKGSTEIKLIGRNPSQQVFAETLLPILLEGDERGTNTVLEMTIEVSEDGLYWFGVLVGNRLMSKMPLRVVYQRLVSGSGGSLTPRG